MKHLVTGFAALLFAGQIYPPAFPRTNATKLLETERIVVWDIVWPNGQPTPMHRHLHDQVGTYYAPGGRAITTPDGMTRQAATAVGALSTTRKGTTHIEEGITDPPLRAVFIEMKDERPSGLPDAMTPFAPAFPRDGAKQLLDDERVTVWDYTWVPGVPARRSQFSRDTVVVYLAPGRMRLAASTTASAENVAPGQMRYYKRGDADTSEAIEGSPRAMIFAFK